MRSLFFPISATIMLLIVAVAFSWTFYFRAFSNVFDLSRTLGQGPCRGTS